MQRAADYASISRFVLSDLFPRAAYGSRYNSLDAKRDRNTLNTPAYLPYGTQPWKLSGLYPAPLRRFLQRRRQFALECGRDRSGFIENFEATRSFGPKRNLTSFGGGPAGAQREPRCLRTPSLRWRSGCASGCVVGLLAHNNQVHRLCEFLFGTNQGIRPSSSSPDSRGVPEPWRPIPDRLDGVGFRCRG
jgi:hypothetical protein